MPRRECTAPSTILERETTFAPNHHERWTESEVMKVMADNTNDEQLSKELGRSINAIRHKRVRVNKQEKKK